MTTRAALLLGNRRDMWSLAKPGVTAERQVEQATARASLQKSIPQDVMFIKNPFLGMERWLKC